MQVLHFSDRQLLDRGLLVEVQDELLAYLDAARPAFVLLSFIEVRQLSSEGVNTLLQARRTVAAYGGQLRLSDLHPEIERLFSILKLEGTVFRIYGSKADALAALA
ncbi:MAG TPA: STAS domain-containing protein [Pirellulales bacterium]